MNQFSEKRIHEQFDLSELSSLFTTVVRMALHEPLSWYVFLHRYTHFNSYAPAAIYRLASSMALSRYLFMESSTLVREEADRGTNLAHQLTRSVLKTELYYPPSRRSLMQAVLQAAGDHAGLLAQERNYLAVIPDWLSHLVDQFIWAYQATPDNIVSLVQAMGFHAASELLDRSERNQLRALYQNEKADLDFQTCLGSHLPLAFTDFTNTEPGTDWYGILGRSHEQLQRETQSEFSALSLLNAMIEYRPEPAQQIQIWAYEGIEAFICLQTALFQGIYRDCLELIHLCYEAVDVA